MSSIIASSVPEEWLALVRNPSLELPFKTFDTSMRDSSANHQSASGNVSQCELKNRLEGSSKRREYIFDTNTSPWHPWSLQKHTIYLFMAAFGIIAIALESIFIMSEKRQGLATASSSATLHYSWTYGPTAIISLLSGIWVCVDYSAKASAPWIRIRNAKARMDVERVLLLDYISPFSILVPFQAAKNRDFLVAATALVSLILTIMSIFSPSLIRLTPVEISVPVQPINKFVNDVSRLDLDDYGKLSLYNIIGLERFNLTNQQGISDGFAYQSFYPSVDSSLELNITVEALSAELECEPASINSFDYTYNPNRYTLTPKFSLSIPGCDLKTQGEPFTEIYLSVPMVYGLQPNNKTYVGNVTRTGGRFLTGDCQGDPHLDAKRLAFIVAEFLVEGSATVMDGNFDGQPEFLSEGQEATAPINITKVNLRTSRQFICQPKYTIRDLNILRDTGRQHASHQILVAESPRSRMLTQVHPWDIANAVLNSCNSSSFYLARWFMTTGPGYWKHLEQVYPVRLGRRFVLPDLHDHVDFDHMTVVIMSTLSSFLDGLMAFNATEITTSIQAYYRTHSAFLVHGALMGSTQEASNRVGHAKVSQNRLIVQSLPCHILFGLCVLSILALGLSLSVLPGGFSLEGDPRTVVGLKRLATDLANFCSEEPGGSKLRDTQDNNSGHSKETESSNNRFRAAIAGPKVSLTNTFHQPWSLHFLSRTFICLVVGVVAVLLEQLLRKSQLGDGIGPATGTHLNYLWTALPAMGSSFISLFLTSMDSELRALMPFYAMRQRPTTGQRSVGMNLHGLLGPHLLYRAVALRNFTAAAATVAAMIGGLLVIASGSIFFEDSRPTILQQRLKLRGSFTSGMFEERNSSLESGWGLGTGPEMGVLCTLMLQNNLSAQPFTFQRLAFPSLALEDLGDGAGTGLTSQNTWSEIETHAVVPALRSGLACRLHPPADIFADILHLDQTHKALHYNESWPEGDTITINVTGEFCGPSANSILNGKITSSELFVTALIHLPDPRTPEGIFGLANIDRTWTPADSRSSTRSCSSFFYVWGRYSPQRVVSASALSCNGTIESLDVNVVFAGADLAINPRRPPRPREKTIRRVLPASASPGKLSSVLYDGLLSAHPLEKGAVMDAFFSILVTSPSGIPILAFADSDPKNQASIVNAIKWQHSIIMTQALSYMARTSEDDSEHGIFDRLGQGTISSTTYPAITFIGGPMSSSLRSNIETNGTEQGRQWRVRVIQDPTATRVMQGLLCSILVFSVASWVLEPKTAVLPRPPTSVASVLALLVDGNVYEFDGTAGKLQQSGTENKLTGIGKGSKRKKSKPVEDKYGFRLGVGSSGTGFISTSLGKCPAKGCEGEDGGDDIRFGIWVMEMPQKTSG